MYCSECRSPCKEVRRNFGIGAYEFWGQTGSQDNWKWVSECCDGEVLTKEQLEEIDELNSTGSGLE